jgi:hypothetical protein
MTIDYRIKHPGVTLAALQPGDVCYTLAEQGVFVERATESFHSCTRIEGPIPLLESHAERCELRTGKIPAAMVGEMLGFFQAAYRLYQGEAALVLLYSPRQRQFAWYCPPQSVEVYSYRGCLSADESVEFDNPLTLPPGFQRFGDAHSHVGHPLPSMMDRRDDGDGLHIVVGHIAGRPMFHIDFVVDGQRFNFTPEGLIEELPPPPHPQPPREWLDSIRLVHHRPSFGYGKALPEVFTAASLAYPDEPRPRNGFRMEFKP